MRRSTVIKLLLALALMAVMFGGGQSGYWLFVGLCALAAFRLAMALVKSMCRWSHNRQIGQPQREMLLKFTAVAMCFFFLTGTIIYARAFKIEQLHFTDMGLNNAEVILRSVICSLDMFMLDVDSNILDRLDHEPMLKGAIMVQAVMSFGCTLVLLFSLIVLRARAYYRLERHTRITGDKNHLYLFFGLNENARMLATDIMHSDSHAIVIFIDNANLSEDESNSWNNIVSLFTHRQKTFKMADKSSALVAIASTRLSEVDDDALTGKSADLLAMLGLGKVKELIKSLETHSDDARLSVFFLSDNEDDNIRSVINIAKDSTLLQAATSGKVSHMIYCHARYNGPNRVIEDLAIRRRLNVEILDSSHLAVELLKSAPDCQPVGVAWFGDGTDGRSLSVAEPVSALIVGFGEVGRDAFRFLYEFGTLVDFTIPGDPRDVYPVITAVDNRMDILGGTFRANAPGIRFGHNRRDDCRLLQIDYNDYRFYNDELSPEACRRLNYIVLALGDDDHNIALASQVFNRIRRFRSDMSHLLIMVRCVDAEKYDLMSKVADHYNQGCGLEGDKAVIRLFGNPRDIYTYRNIIRDDLTERGKQFFSTYQMLEKNKETWRDRRLKLTRLNDALPGELIKPDVDSLRKLRRQENQDLANALHIHTKHALLRRVLGSDCDMAYLMRRLQKAEGGSALDISNLSYPRLSPDENRAIRQMAVIEHARWNAAHSLLGYRPADNNGKCDERTMEHGCITSWKGLDALNYNVKQYDFYVVETTLAILTRDD